MTRIKTLFVLGVLLAPPTIAARTLNVDEAKHNAEAFICKITDKGSLAAPNLSAATPLSRSANPLYYIFNIDDNRGYIIASADDRFHEILGYADKGSYRADGSNPAFEWWLEAITEEMAKAPASSTASRSNADTDTTMPDVAPLLATKWNQDNPYNIYCPLYIMDTPYAPTGCVATAMAQVINYHKWPQFSSNNFEYQWDLMLNSYDGSESKEAINQVARLMRDCGVSVNMDYGPTESGANTFAIPKALVNDFQYDDSSIKSIFRESYGSQEINKILTTELKEGRPIITSGTYPETAGHAFVIDGCNSSGFYHVNWGWGGSLNGYFRITSLCPSGYGIGGDINGYSFNIHFITGIQPKRNTAPSQMRPVLTGLGDLSIENVTTDTIVIDYNENNRLKFTTINHIKEGYGFVNTGTENFYLNSLRTKIVNLTTGKETIVNESSLTGTLGSGYYRSNSLQMGHGPLEESVKYKISLVYQLDENLCDVEFGIGRRSYLLLERTGDKLTIIQPEVKCDITGKIVGDIEPFPNRDYTHAITASFFNNYSEEYLGAVKCKFSDSEGKVIDNMTSYVMVDILPEESFVGDLIFNFSNATPGKYTLSFYDFRDKLISESYDIEIYDTSAKLDESTFPDAALRNYLSENFDSDKNGTLSPIEIDNIHTFNLNNTGITDFTGIEHLWYLVNLRIDNEKITTLDLSSKERLFELGIKDTPIEILKLPENTDEEKSLVNLQLIGTQIKELDLSKSKYLSYLKIADTPVEQLKFGEHPNLKDINITNTAIRTLDISGCTGLMYSNIYQNESLKDINASGLSNLENLSCSENALENLNVAGSKNLKTIMCQSNKLTRIDISGLEKLEYVYFNNNNISEFTYSSHPLMKQLSLTNNSIQGTIDLEKFPALEYLYISNNQLTGTLDLSKVPSIIYVLAENNQLDKLILGDNPKLNRVRVADNLIEGCIDLSKATDLCEFSAYSNNINEVTGIGAATNLTELVLNFNQIEGTLDIRGAVNLSILEASNNKISRFLYSDNSELTSLSITSNRLSHIHLEDFPKLTTYTKGPQNLQFEIESDYFDLSDFIEAGFDINRAANWEITWTGAANWYPVEIEDAKLKIPSDASDNIIITYVYCINSLTKENGSYTLELTRNTENSIEGITADDYCIKVEGNTITMPADGIKEIYNVSGMTVYRGNDSSITLNSPGIYVVCFGGRSFKVVIR